MLPSCRVSRTGGSPAVDGLARIRPARPKSQWGSSSRVFRRHVKKRQAPNRGAWRMDPLEIVLASRVPRARAEGLGGSSGVPPFLRQPPGSPATGRVREMKPLEETAARVECFVYLNEMRGRVFDGEFILAEAVPAWGRER